MLAFLPRWGSDIWVAVGTLALAAVTFGLGCLTIIQVWLSRRTIQTGLRPLLLDVPLGGDNHGEVDIGSDDHGVWITVPLLNAGNGLALIAGGPKLHWPEAQNWEGVAARLGVPAGEKTRLEFKAQFETAEAANQAALTLRNFEAEVSYTDINGRQRTRTKAYVIHHPDDQAEIDHFVDRIELFKRKRKRPFAVLSARTQTGRAQL